ncbi:hypothetical protein VAE122_3060156 [Vibrio aestuarianus]|nr:hypothetical protein VAE122_3060156 [Vibrio aestuarianus]
MATLNSTVDANSIETYTAALLNKHGIVYLHIAEVDWDDVPDTQSLLNAHYERVTKAF